MTQSPAVSTGIEASYLQQHDIMGAILEQMLVQIVMPKMPAGAICINARSQAAYLMVPKQSTGVARPDLHSHHGGDASLMLNLVSLHSCTAGCMRAVTGLTGRRGLHQKSACWPARSQPGLLGVLAACR